MNVYCKNHCSTIHRRGSIRGALFALISELDIGGCLVIDDVFDVTGGHVQRSVVRSQLASIKKDGVFVMTRVKKDQLHIIKYN